MKHYHVSNGRAYGPAFDNESLSDYRQRVKKAYGSLGGVRFVTLPAECRHDPIYTFTGQCEKCKAP